MKNSFYIDLQRFMLIPTKFPLTPNNGRRTLSQILHVNKKRRSEPSLNPVIRLGFEPKTPSLKGMCSTS